MSCIEIEAKRSKVVKVVVVLVVVMSHRYPLLKEEPGTRREAGMGAVVVVAVATERSGKAGVRQVFSLLQPSRVRVHGVDSDPPPPVAKETLFLCVPDTCPNLATPLLLLGAI